MTEKCEVEAAIYASLRRTTRWRQSVAKRFPSDPRNLAAVEQLESLSRNVTLSAEQWACIVPHMGNRERWNEALSDTSRCVGMRTGFESFDAYTQRLVEALQ